MQLFAEKEAAKRQSTMLLMEVASDRKLMKAMVEIEDLTRQLEQQKRQYEEQVLNFTIYVRLCFFKLNKKHFFNFLLKLSTDLTACSEFLELLAVKFCFS